jgi:hypothetical protein
MTQEELEEWKEWAKEYEEYKLDEDGDPIDEPTE